MGHFSRLIKKSDKAVTGRWWTMIGKEMIEYKYTNCFVAYLDILGFKERVKKKSPESLSTLIEALQINSRFTHSSKKKHQMGN